MAVTDWNQLTSVTREKILPGVIDQISDSHPLLKRFLGKAKRLDGGQRIEQIIKYANSSQGGSYAGLETLSTTAEQTRTRAYWPWKQYQQPIVLSNIDVAKNGGTEGVKKLIPQETEEAGVDLKQLMATDLYDDGTGNSGKEIDGLIAVADDGTNVATYGNINRSTYTWWAGNYSAAVGSLTLSHMASQYDAAKSGEDKPSLIVTDEATWRIYESLLHPQVRYTYQANGKPKIDGGFEAMMFRGTPVISDEFCDSGYMYFLNEKYLQVFTLAHPKYKTDKMGFSMSDLQAPVNQDGQIGRIFWYGNLVCTQPRRQAVSRGLTA